MQHIMEQLRHNLFKVKKRLYPALLVMICIFALSHQPGDSLPSPEIWNIDKLAHLVIYGLLSASCIYALAPVITPANINTFVYGIVFFCFLYGISDEFHQHFIPMRYPSFTDIVADTIGAILVCSYWRHKVMECRR